VAVRTVNRTVQNVDNSRTERNKHTTVDRVLLSERHFNHFNIVAWIDL